MRHLQDSDRVENDAGAAVGVGDGELHHVGSCAGPCGDATVPCGCAVVCGKGWRSPWGLNKSGAGVLGPCVDEGSLADIRGMGDCVRGGQGGLFARGVIVGVGDDLVGNRAEVVIELLHACEAVVIEGGEVAVVVAGFVDGAVEAAGRAAVAADVEGH